MPPSPSRAPSSYRSCCQFRAGSTAVSSAPAPTAVAVRTTSSMVDPPPRPVPARRFAATRGLRGNHQRPLLAPLPLLVDLVVLAVDLDRPDLVPRIALDLPGEVE